MSTKQHQRRGTIYLMVMVTVAIVVTLGLSSLALVRVQRRVAAETRNLTDARSGALSAVEHGVAIIELSPNWRTEAVANSGSLGSFSFGRGTMSMTVSDPTDADLADSDSDPVDLVGTGSVVGAVQMYGVRLAPLHQPMTSLKAGIAAASNVTLTNAIVLGWGGEGLASNGAVTATSSKVRIPVKAAGAVSGSTYYASTTGAQAAIQFPDATMIATYKAMGAEITSSGMSGRRVENVLFSPSVNPHGAVNSRGIYWLDCNGEDYVIQNCRIVGTLVLLRCTGNVSIEGSVNWEPAVAGMPALIVQGKVQFRTTVALLKESTVDRNLNPASTPYLGVSDSDKTDSYPSRIKGLVYASGDTQFLGETQIDGALIVGGTLAGGGTLSVLYDDALYYSPPYGFRASTVMSVVPGSFAQVVY